MKKYHFHQLSSKPSIVAGLGLVFLVGLFLLTCSKKERSNPLDPSNPSTQGDPFRLKAGMKHNGVVSTLTGITNQSLYGYRLYRRNYRGNQYDVHGGTNLSIRTYIDESLQNDSLYRHKVCAITSAGEWSVWSNLRSVRVTQPWISRGIVNSYKILGSARGVAVSNNHAFVADDNSGLQIISISKPAPPKLTGSHNTLGEAIDVAVTGSYAYVVDRKSGLQIIRVCKGA